MSSEVVDVAIRPSEDPGSLRPSATSAERRRSMNTEKRFPQQRAEGKNLTSQMGASGSAPSNSVKTAGSGDVSTKTRVIAAARTPTRQDDSSAAGAQATCSWKLVVGIVLLVICCAGFFYWCEIAGVDVQPISHAPSAAIRDHRERVDRAYREQNERLPRPPMSHADASSALSANPTDENTTTVTASTSAEVSTTAPPAPTPAGSAFLESVLGVTPHARESERDKAFLQSRTILV
ncbi:unnamed protein product [Amoebophrya sp. A120]|nr:unnamed protein product [Amoebophrya sp. A120]|eukprot:GSA120T00020219001.1